MIHCSPFQIYPFCDPLSVSMIYWRSQERLSSESATCWTSLLSKPQLFLLLYLFSAMAIPSSCLLRSWSEYDLCVWYSSCPEIWLVHTVSDSIEADNQNNVLTEQRTNTVTFVCALLPSLHYKNFWSHNCSFDSFPTIFTNLLIKWEQATWGSKLPESFQFYRVFAWILQISTCAQETQWHSSSS